jgi:hypothetical protein
MKTLENRGIIYADLKANVHFDYLAFQKANLYNEWKFNAYNVHKN